MNGLMPMILLATATTTTPATLESLANRVTTLERYVTDKKCYHFNPRHNPDWKVCFPSNFTPETSHVWKFSIVNTGDSLIVEGMGPSTATSRQKAKIDLTYRYDRFDHARDYRLRLDFEYGFWDTTTYPRFPEDRAKVIKYHYNLQPMRLPQVERVIAAFVTTFKIGVGNSFLACSRPVGKVTWIAASGITHNDDAFVESVADVVTINLPRDSLGTALCR